jgi:hypothetical protein
MSIFEKIRISSLLWIKIRQVLSKDIKISAPIITGTKNL